MRFDWKPALAALCCLGCADFHRGPAQPDAAPAEVAPAGDPTFETAVYPLLQANCWFCHRKDNYARDSRLLLTGDARADRAMVVALVAPGNPTESLLLMRASGQSHGGGDVLTADSADYLTIADWIAKLPAAP